MAKSIPKTYLFFDSMAKEIKNSHKLWSRCSRWQQHTFSLDKTTRVIVGPSCLQKNDMNLRLKQSTHKHRKKATVLRPFSHPAKQF